MNFLVAAILILSPPSPELCRQHGVAVKDGQKATGEIVEYNIAHARKVSARCMGSSKKGCTIPVMEDQYVIWTVDDTFVRTHEECHALYQARDHILPATIKEKPAWGERVSLRTSNSCVGVEVVKGKREMGKPFAINYSTPELFCKQYRGELEHSVK